MPPRASARQRRRGARGRGTPMRGGPRGDAPAPSLPSTAAHVTAIGVKRPAVGTGGKGISVMTNHFEVTTPDKIIHHYDAISPPRTVPRETVLPVRLNMELIRRLQEAVAPQIFNPRAVYDGRKNIFASHKLDLGEDDEREFDVTQGAVPAARVFKIRLKYAASINPEVLDRFIEGQQSHDNNVLTAITALNVVIRMEPTMRYPYNVRSFFTDRETKDIGAGIVLWRGYFQSIRPGVGRMLINIDISTGAMYKPGALIALCLDFLGQRDPRVLAFGPNSERVRLRLQRFISGVRVMATSPGQAQMAQRTPRTIKGLTSDGANALTFQTHAGVVMTVAQYFQQTYNYNLRYPNVVCVQVGSGALIPLELCQVPPGQIMRKEIPSEKTTGVIEFATKKPQDRLSSIQRGVEALAYEDSEYVESFGLKMVKVNVGDDDGNGDGDDDGEVLPLSLDARVLQPPVLKYGQGSKQPTFTPRDGSWNMIDKRFFIPGKIDAWAVVVYERAERFTQRAAQEMVQSLLTACRNAGITIGETDPIIRYENAQGRIPEQLKSAGQACRQKNDGKIPSIIVVVLPDGATDTYTAVKHFGDVTIGVATQCLRSSRCSRAKPLYFANVSLKINVKLGGTNMIASPDQHSASILNDPQNPTIVMGADVMHPAPGSGGRPSFTALVSSVDSDTAKYIADCRAQKSRQELIEDLKDMTKHMLEMYMGYRKNIEKKADTRPKRLIFYRDGVSEGQFQQVLDIELPRIKEACQELKINPKITLVIVGKRHHVRFFPHNPSERDRDRNCPAGTIIDHTVTSPLEFDWYLQSHHGRLGTARPAHYNVLHDDNGFTPDGLQALSYALCHVYARSTSSVSIPAPVYYADIVCARAKNQIDPQASMNLSESATQTGSPTEQLEAFKSGFKPLHPNTTRMMYFS